MKNSMTKVFSNIKDYIINAKSDSKNRTVLIISISLILNIIILSFAFIFINVNYFRPVSIFDSTNIEIEIERNSSVSKISKELEEHNLIRNATVFKYYIDFSDYTSKIKSGNYTLNKTMSMKEIAKELTKGGVSNNEIKVVITEGMTIDQIATKLKNAGVINDEQSFKNECNNIEAYSEYDFIAALDGKTSGKRYALEGYLFPDTYNFFIGSSNNEVIKKLLNRFNAIMVSEWSAKAEKMDMTIDQIVTLASIIEKEGKTKDFNKVSSVLLNRINSNMKLELCSTVQYAKGITRLALTNEDISYDSPYNTYKYSGLPPSAVCNPGQKALSSALYPDEQYMNEKYLFFCSTDPVTGDLAFSKTATQHQANVDKYRDLWVQYDKNNGN